MESLIDATGQSFKTDLNPGQIVSLVPSLTETLFALGLTSERIAGRTRFCVRPDISDLRKIPAIGGTKNPSIDRIREIGPDLVLANKEENRKQDVEALRNFTKVYVTNPQNVDDALRMIEDLGFLLGGVASGRAGLLLQGIRNDLSKVNAQVKTRKPLSYLYFIWQKPFMVAGQGTFIEAMLKQIKCENAIQKPRYPEVSKEDIFELDPDWLFLSTEPYPFKEEHIDKIEEELEGLRAVEEGRVCIVDGQACSWYGSRLSESFEYLSQLREFIDS